MMWARLAAIATVTAVLVLIAVSVEVAYVNPAKDIDLRTASLESDLAQVSARLTRARSELAAVDLGGAPLDNLVDVSDGAAASAEGLQAVVRDAVASGGGLALSSQTGSRELVGGYNKVTLVLRARFDELGLMAFVRLIETQSPAILIEALDVQQIPAPGDSRSLDVTASLAGVQSVAPN